MWRYVCTYVFVFWVVHCAHCPLCVNIPSPVLRLSLSVSPSQAKAPGRSAPLPAQKASQVGGLSPPPPRHFPPPEGVMSALHLRHSPPPRRSLSSTSLALAPTVRPWGRKRWWVVFSPSLPFGCWHVCFSHLLILSHTFNTNPRMRTWKPRYRSCRGRSMTWRLWANTVPRWWTLTSVSTAAAADGHIPAFSFSSSERVGVKQKTCSCVELKLILHFIWVNLCLCGNEWYKCLCLFVCLFVCYKPNIFDIFYFCFQLMSVHFTEYNFFCNPYLHFCKMFDILIGMPKLTKMPT